MRSVRCDAERRVCPNAEQRGGVDVGDFADLFSMVLVARDRVQRWTIRPVPEGWGRYRRPAPRGLRKRVMR